MITVGAAEAMAQLTALLDRVAAGEEVLITRDGQPVARMTSATDPSRAEVDAAIRRLKELRSATRLEGSDWKSLRDEGRR